MKTKRTHFTGANYGVKLYGVVDETDELVAIDKTEHKARVAYLRQFESFGDEDHFDADISRKNCEELMKENNAVFVEINGNYTVKREYES